MSPASVANLLCELITRVGKLLVLLAHLQSACGFALRVKAQRRVPRSAGLGRFMCDVLYLAARQIEPICDGVQVAHVGSPVDKSSLFIE
jgi:hypothetical protein